MKTFTFNTDDKGELFCLEIAREMVRLFKIPFQEAIGRINREWKNVDLVGDEHAIYHDTTDFYARDVYFGHDSKWWKDESRAKPQPYP